MSLVTKTEIVKITLGDDHSSYQYGQERDASKTTKEAIKHLRWVAKELETLFREGYRLEGSPFRDAKDNSLILVFTMTRGKEDIKAGEGLAPVTEEQPVEITPELAEKSIEDLEVSVGLYNVLKNANIRTIGEAARRTEAEWLRTKNLRKKTLQELKKVLGDLGLSLRAESQA